LYFHSPVAGFSLLILEVFDHIHDTPHSVGLLWTSDQSVAETSTWQHTTLTTDRHPCLRGIRTQNLSGRAAEDLNLRPHGHWDQLFLLVIFHYNIKYSLVCDSPCWWPRKAETCRRKYDLITSRMYVNRRKVHFWTHICDYKWNSRASFNIIFTAVFGCIYQC
jgi:hypothetical protein